MITAPNNIREGALLKMQQAAPLTALMSHLVLSATNEEVSADLVQLHANTYSTLVVKLLAYQLNTAA